MRTRSPSPGLRTAPHRAGPRPGRPPVRRRTQPLGRQGTRLRGGFGFLLLVLALLAGRLVWLQGFHATAYADKAVDQRIRTNTIVAPRGTITDRSGEPFALSLDARAVYGEPRIIARAECKPDAKKPCNPATIAAALAPVLQTPAAELEEKLSRSSAFVYLARGLDPAVGKTVRDLGLVGVGVLQEPKRTHPGGDLAVSVTGFTDREGKGLMGVESGMDDVLRGKNGRTTAEVDTAGRVIPTGATTSTPAVPGRDVQLTIDRDLQWYAQQVLAQKVAETEAVNGTAVVMDVQTGEVLALATSPTFNPDSRNAKTSPQALKNVAIADVYEPGSVNKVITAAAALESGVVTPATPIVVPPTYQVGRHTVHDAERHGTEHLTFAGVLAKSSNIGTVMVAQKVGAERLYDAMRRFGYGEKTGLGLPGETRGLLPKPADWSGTSIATIPIGQGVSVNVMQVASVYATVANGGVRVTPTVVKAVADSSGHLVPAAKPASRRVISPEVAAQLRGMLEAVVSEEGTAPLAAVPGYRIAGKTGTAQRVVDGRYAAGNYTSSFIGFAPADAPRLVTAVVLQGTGRRGYYGGATAGPVFQSVMSFALRGLKIAPTGTTAPPITLTTG
ncbi:MAG: penicillin-binding protein 2 [Actinobacteria bacterium]|nr:penicillin-binding protein 2 [Actinomycetota bacterium]MCA1720540.1 penicillin-binding protein 2 [Actinomycetota bacterium]